MLQEAQASQRKAQNQLLINFPLSGERVKILYQPLCHLLTAIMACQHSLLHMAATAILTEVELHACACFALRCHSIFLSFGFILTHLLT
jgi:hypothetical protein